MGRLRRLLDDERAGRRAGRGGAQSRLDTFQKAANDDAARPKGRDDAAAKLAAADAEAARLREALRDAESKTPSKSQEPSSADAASSSRARQRRSGGAGVDGGVPSGTPARELEGARAEVGRLRRAPEEQEEQLPALRARRKEKEKLALQAKLEQRLTHSAY